MQTSDTKHTGTDGMAGSGDAGTKIGCMTDAKAYALAAPGRICNRNVHAGR